MTTNTALTYALSHYETYIAWSSLLGVLGLLMVSLRDVKLEHSSDSVPIWVLLYEATMSVAATLYEIWRESKLVFLFLVLMIILLGWLLFLISITPKKVMEKFF